MNNQLSKRYPITAAEVSASWKAVRSARGGPGLDHVTIEMIESRLTEELYKIQNRMSSGSYQAQPVKLTPIPKANGKLRYLGIPTVIDRIAQGIIANRLVEVLEPIFHEDSYAYREGKSATDAVLKARSRCGKAYWVAEFDIKGYFDVINHPKMLKMVRKHTQDPLTLLYVRKFLKAQAVNDKSETIVRTQGTPQGGVVSPVLANLYLHEALDTWLKKEYPHILFERYADDFVLHCVSEKQALFTLRQVNERLRAYDLELNPDKTGIVYCGFKELKGTEGRAITRKFTFLGYDFKLRRVKKIMVFRPAMGQGALVKMRQQLQELRLYAKTHYALEEVCKLINLKTRGWIGYYHHAWPAELYRMASLVDARMIKWIKKKMKICFHGKAWDMYKLLRKQQPDLLYHWYGIQKYT